MISDLQVGACSLRWGWRSRSLRCPCAAEWRQTTPVEVAGWGSRPLWPPQEASLESCWSERRRRRAAAAGRSPPLLHHLTRHRSLDYTPHKRWDSLDFTCPNFLNLIQNRTEESVFYVSEWHFIQHRSPALGTDRCDWHLISAAWSIAGAATHQIQITFKFYSWICCFCGENKLECIKGLLCCWRRKRRFFFLIFSTLWDVNHIDQLI